MEDNIKVEESYGDDFEEKETDFRLIRGGCDLDPLDTVTDFNFIKKEVMVKLVCDEVKPEIGVGSVEIDTSEECRSLLEDARVLKYFVKLEDPHEIHSIDQHMIQDTVTDFADSDAVGKPGSISYGSDSLSTNDCFSDNENVINNTVVNEHISSNTSTVASKCFKNALEGYKAKQSFEKNLFCGICKKSFSQSFLLDRHLLKHASRKIFRKCNFCGKTFSRGNTLKIHLHTHTGAKPFLCNICGKNFSHPYSLKIHLQMHTKDKTVLCNVCGKTFYDTSNFKSHLRTHTGTKPFACNMCEKSFSQASNLKTHLRTHTGAKPFVCNVCGKTFSQSCHLKIHLRSHTGLKPFVCNVCGRKFTQKCNLKTHLRQHQE